MCRVRLQPLRENEARHADANRVALHMQSSNGRTSHRGLEDSKHERKRRRVSTSGPHRAKGTCERVLRGIRYNQIAMKASSAPAPEETWQ